MKCRNLFLSACPVLLIPLALFASSPSLRYVEDLTQQMSAEARSHGQELKLEAVLNRIGSDFPELRSHFILMHDSRSRQHASYEFPRVISFAPDARFAMAFNGDPQSEGYYELEMFEFGADPAGERSNLTSHVQSSAMLRDSYRSESFKFRRIIFKPAGNYHYDQEYREEPRFPAIKPINEQKCQGCHGKSTRPNWESYNRWEGSYFSDDTRRTGPKYALEEGADHDGFDSFYTKHSSSERYRFLNGLVDQYVLPGKGNGERVAPSQFTQVAAYLNYRRLAHLILQSPDFDTFKYAILGALYDCRNFDAFIPASIAKSMANPLSWYRADTDKSFSLDENRYFLESHAGSMTKLRFLFEGRGLSMAKWSMSFRRSPYSFVTPLGEMQGFLSATLIELDPSLEPGRVYQVRGEYDSAMQADFVKEWTGDMEAMVGPACASLQKASESAFTKYQPPTVIAKPEGLKQSAAEASIRIRK